MNTAVNQVIPTGAPNALAAQTAATKEEPVVEIKRAWFSPAQADATEKAIADAQAKSDAHNIAIFANWDEVAPDNQNVGIVPIAAKRGAQPIAVAVVSFPTLDQVFASGEAGQKYVQDVFAASMLGRAAGSLRAMLKAGESAIASLPRTIEDFITRQSRDQGLAAYRELSKPYIKVLVDEKGFKVLDSRQFRSIMMSAHYAAQVYPQIKAGTWAGLLNLMIEKAEAQGIDPGAMLAWRDSRDQFVIQIGEDFDLDDLASLVDKTDADADEDQDDDADDEMDDAALEAATAP